LALAKKGWLTRTGKNDGDGQYYSRMKRGRIKSINVGSKERNQDKRKRVKPNQKSSVLEAKRRKIRRLVIQSRSSRKGNFNPYGRTRRN